MTGLPRLAGYKQSLAGVHRRTARGSVNQEYAAPTAAGGHSSKAGAFIAI